jgi:hypothetical protein
MPLVEGVFKSWLNSTGEYEQHIELLPIGKIPSRDTSLEDAIRDAAGTVRFLNRYEGSSSLQLTHLPVWDASLEVREQVDALAGQAPGAFGIDTVLTQGADYWLDVDEIVGGENFSRSGRLFRSGYWPSEPRCVKVTYYGGETAARLASNAAHIKAGALICHLTAYKALAGMSGSGANTGGKTSETIGKYSYSTPESILKAFTILNFGVPLAAQEAAGKAKNYAVFG